MSSNVPKTNVWVSLLSGAASSLVLFIAMTTYQAHADNSGGVAQPFGPMPTGFAYEGHLDWDGVPYSGEAEMHFQLFPAATNGPCLWEDVQRVRVHSGRFSTHLNVPDHTLDSGALHIGIAVKKCDDAECNGEMIDLESRQRISPTPYARLTAGATNLDVRGRLQAYGTATFEEQTYFNNALTVVGPASFNQLSVAGPGTFNQGLSVAGDVNLPAGAINANELASSVAGTGLTLTPGEPITVDPVWLQGQIGTWVRQNCTVALGYGRDSNDVEPDRNSNLSRGAWAPVDIAENIDDDNNLFIRFSCD